MKLVRTQRPTHFFAATLACAALGTVAGAQLGPKSPGLAYPKTPGETAPPAADAALAPRSKQGAPAGLPLAARHIDHSRMYYSDTADAVWARGASYKARFGSDGLEYTPMFGASPPANYPPALDLASVPIAGDALSLNG